MQVRRSIAVLGVALVLLTGALRPRVALADDDDGWKIAGIVVGSIVGYVLFIVTGTKLAYGYQPDALGQEDPLRTYERQDGELHLAGKCRATDGNLPLACW